MKKRILSLTLVLVLCLGLSGPVLNVYAASAVPESITIYALSDGFKNYLSIPADFPQSYSLAGHTVKIQEGNSVEVDKDGKVTVAGNTWYYHQNDSGWWVGSTAPSGQPGEYSTFDYNFGDSVLLVDGTQEVTVHAKSYAAYYAEKKMDNYLAQNVKLGMNQYQIAELCCRFVAGYNYSVEASDYVGMIVTGGGDCWASTDALIYMLSQWGITCSSRDASNEPGAGSQHVNVAAQLDGNYYILEAGYTGTAPRKYDLKKQESSSAFTYKQVNYEGVSGIYITGLTIDSGVTDLVIPSQIDGMTVIGIEDGAFSGNHELVSVSIPGSVVYLGEEAFYQNIALEKVQLSEGLKTIGSNCFTWDESLTQISIPSTVTQIDGNVFCYCEKLASIPVAEGNQNYCSQDGVLFTKNMDTLLIFPAGKGETLSDSYSLKDFLANMEASYTIPNGVRTIQQWAFAEVNLAKVNFPSTLNEIESFSFYSSKIAEMALPSGVTTIENSAFRGIYINRLTLPSNLRKIDDGAFYNGHIQGTIIIPSTVESVGDLAFAGNKNLYVRVPASVKEIGQEAFNFQKGWFSMDTSSSSAQVSTGNMGAVFFEKDCHPTSIGENAFGEEMLCVYPGSYMNTYAQQNNLSWYPLNANGTVDVKEEWLTGTKFDTAKGRPLIPTFNWKNSDGTCPFGMNMGAFDITYSDNVNPGKCEITLVGKDFLSGTLHTTFDILPGSGSSSTSNPVQTTPSVPAEQSVSNKFVDVKENDYFAIPVTWALENGITEGTSTDHFSPELICNKAQILTFLWRASGKPEPNISNPFVDVKESDYYYKAALWASEKGIISGFEFTPESECTRAMTVLYLWQEAGSPAPSSKADFTDVDQNAVYADAVAWAVEQEITNGIGNGEFSPDLTCTRGQIVTFLYRDLA